MKHSTEAVEGVSTHASSSSVYATEGIDTTNEKTTAVNRTASEVVSNPEKALTVSDAKVTRGKLFQKVAESDDGKIQSLIEDDNIQGTRQDVISSDELREAYKAYKVTT